MVIKQVKDSEVVNLLSKGVKVNRVNINSGMSASLVNYSIKDIRLSIESGKYLYYIVEDTDDGPEKA